MHQSDFVFFSKMRSVILSRNPITITTRPPPCPSGQSYKQFYNYHILQLWFHKDQKLQSVRLYSDDLRRRMATCVLFLTAQPGAEQTRQLEIHQQFVSYIHYNKIKSFYKIGHSRPLFPNFRLFNEVLILMIVNEIGQ